MKILFISDFVPYLSLGGDRLRAASLIDWLNDSGYDISFLLVQANFIRQNELCALRSRCRKIYILDLRSARKGFRQEVFFWARKFLSLFSWGRRYLRNRDHAYRAAIRASSKVDPIDAYWSEHAINKLSKLICAIEHPQVVICEYITMTRCFEFPEFLGSLKIIDAHEVMHERLKMLDKGLSAWIACPAEEEAHYLRRADVVMANSFKDAETFSRLISDREVIVAGQPFITKPVPQKDSSFSCLVVGTNHDVNLEGLWWYQKNVWPLVLRQIPSAKFLVAGDMGEYVIPDPSVEVLGRVENIDEVYEHAAIVIVPVFSGGPLKMKLVEALSKGKAIVATAHAASGLRDSQALLWTDDPTLFAQYVINLFKDNSLRKDLEEQALEFSRKHLNRDEVYKSLKDLLNRHKDANEGNKK